MIIIDLLLFLFFGLLNKPIKEKEDLMLYNIPIMNAFYKMKYL